jgi:hypothetical protein
MKTKKLKLVILMIKYRKQRFHKIINIFFYVEKLFLIGNYLNIVIKLNILINSVYITVLKFKLKFL